MKTALGRTVSILALASIVLASFQSAGLPLQQNLTLPAQMSDADFWRLVSDFSEPNGNYRSDNFISNEASIVNVIPPLKRLSKAGGVYIGVGPEQNFTYAAALRPKIAFVVDIRRQNMLVLMMYKALFELSPTRADFVGRLFSRKRPAGLDEKTSVAALFAAFGRAAQDDVAANGRVLRDTLSKHGYDLNSDDLASINHIYEVLSRGGPSMTQDFESPNSPGGIPVTYAEMMTATDGDGQTSSFLGSEDAYQYVREMQRKNLIVPVTGDFSGPTALRKIGQYLKDRNVNVSAFYISNVELYLQGQKMKDFHANVASLPMDARSLLIRWVPLPSTPNLTWYTPSMGPVVTGLAPMAELVDLFKAGRSPSTWAEAVRSTQDPADLARRFEDPSLRRVRGLVTGAPALQPNELLVVELVENPRGSGLLLHVEAAPDGSFEFRNVKPRAYQAIVLKTCRNCDSSSGLGISVPVTVGAADISGLQLTVK